MFRVGVSHLFMSRSLALGAFVLSSLLAVLVRTECTFQWNVKCRRHLTVFNLNAAEVAAILANKVYRPVAFPAVHAR